MLVENGINELYKKFKIYHYQVTELNPFQTQSGQPGLSATKDGVTYLLDGQLYINNELVQVPNGEPFDIEEYEHIEWFANHMEELRVSFFNAHKNT